MPDATPPTTKPPYTWPTFASGGVPAGDFPYNDWLQQLQSAFWALPGYSYGRWNGTGASQNLGYPQNGVPLQNMGGGGNTGLLGGIGAGGGGPAPTMTPQSAGGGGTTPAGDPGFGAAPSSAAFGNLTDADKAYLWYMNNQYRQDLRNMPGAHQLFKDMFGGQYSPQQINQLVNDIGYNDPLITQTSHFNANQYSGPLKAQYEALVRQMGGTPHPMGTWTGLPAAQADALRRFGPNLINFRTGQRVGLLGA